MAVKNNLGRTIASKDHTIPLSALELVGERAVLLDVRLGQHRLNGSKEGVTLYLNLGVPPRPLGEVCGMG
jgi:hypothetical protein